MGLRFQLGPSKGVIEKKFEKREVFLTIPIRINVVLTAGCQSNSSPAETDAVL